MGARTKTEGARIDALLKRARINLISRTARVYSRLGRFLSRDLNIIVQWWITQVLREAESDVASGEILSVPGLPASAERTIREVMVHALVQGYWLQHVYMQECRAAARGQRYRGCVTLADDTELDDEEIRKLLESLMKAAKVEGDPAWHVVIPTDAVKWIEGYTPKLAGVLERDILEKVRGVVRESMFTGSTLKQRMEALREADPKIRAMGKHRVEAIARTEVTRADNMGRLIDMKSNPDVLGVEFSAVLDDRTTDMCRERHGLVMRMDDPRLPYNTPPIHVRCRSLLLAATVYEHPDGLLTSHEFDDIEPGTQRPEDIEAVREVLGSVEEVSIAGAPKTKKDLQLAKQVSNREKAKDLRDEFKDSPEFIQKLYTEHKDSLDFIGTIKNSDDAFYDHSGGSREIWLGSHEQEKNVLVHEFGHHVDYSMGRDVLNAKGFASSEDASFVDVVNEAMRSVKGPGKAKAALRARMEIAMLDEEEMRKNPAVSDIFCAITKARDPMLYGAYGHEKEYFKDDVCVRAEIFANLFQLHAHNDHEAIEFLNGFFPDIISVFLKVTGGE